MSDDHLVLLISGMPGTGKSSFSKWLAEEHGFQHHDVDWHGLPAQGLLQHGRHVIDWGFPANEPGLTAAITIIQSWLADGAEHWWFDGDRGAVLQSFLRRNTVTKQAWDIQVRGIERNWNRISSLFAGRILRVIEPGPD